MIRGHAVVTEMTLKHINKEVNGIIGGQHIIGEQVLIIITIAGRSMYLVDHDGTQSSSCWAAVREVMAGQGGQFEDTLELERNMNILMK
jgi:hypothetical protein